MERKRPGGRLEIFSPWAAAAAERAERSMRHNPASYPFQNYPPPARHRTFSHVPGRPRAGAGE